MVAKKKPADGAAESKRDTEQFLAWLEDVPDPRERYRRATTELEKHQQVIEQLSSVRAEAVSDAYASGETVRALAEELGMSPARLHQLIQQSKARTSKGTGPKRRSRDRQKGES